MQTKVEVVIIGISSIDRESSAAVALTAAQLSDASRTSSTTEHNAYCWPAVGSLTESSKHTHTHKDIACSVHPSAFIFLLSFLIFISHFTFNFDQQYKRQQQQQQQHCDTTRHEGDQPS